MSLVTSSKDSWKNVTMKRLCALILLLVTGSIASPVLADSIPVKLQQGSMYGFLVLKSAEGKVIATGDQINVAQGNQVHSRLVFHFRDGSIDDETSVFKQGKYFNW
jgi:hypothetical protein